MSTLIWMKKPELIQKCHLNKQIRARNLSQRIQFYAEQEFHWPDDWKEDTGKKEYHMTENSRKIKSMHAVPKGPRRQNQTAMTAPYKSSNLYNNSCYATSRSDAAIRTTFKCTFMPPPPTPPLLLQGRLWRHLAAHPVTSRRRDEILILLRIVTSWTSSSSS